MLSSSSGHIQGSHYATILTKFIANQIAKLTAQPGLAVILVGDNPASAVYVRHKIKKTTEVGMQSFEHRLAQNTPEADLLALIEKLNQDTQVNGILVQLPLPDHISEGRVLSAIDPNKDVDGFHPHNIGMLNALGTGIAPCTPLGCLMLLKSQRDLTGAHALVIGRSNIVGKPMAQLLLQHNATVTLAHSRTRNLAQLCQAADIIVVAIGKPYFIQADWIQSGALILDVGINVLGKNEQGKQILQGDVAPGVEQRALVSPVPGGIGPMTIACLLHNTLLLHTKRANDAFSQPYVLDDRLLERNWDTTLA